jgi:hypothetical protein
MYGIYQGHESEIKKLQDDKNQPGFGTAMKGFSLMNELRNAQANALAEQHMSVDEYNYIVTIVYTTWGSKMANEVKPAAASAVEGLKKTIQEMDKQIADPNTPEVLKEGLKKTKEGMEAQIKSYSEIANPEPSQSVPQSNIQLFTKYEKEIQKYYMAGLEYLGF